MSTGDSHCWLLKSWHSLSKKSKTQKKQKDKKSKRQKVEKTKSQKDKTLKRQQIKRHKVEKTKSQKDKKLKRQKVKKMKSWKDERLPRPYWRLMCIRRRDSGPTCTRVQRRPQYMKFKEEKMDNMWQMRAVKSWWELINISVKSKYIFVFTHMLNNFTLWAKQSPLYSEWGSNAGFYGQ